MESGSHVASSRRPAGFVSCRDDMPGSATFTNRPHVTPEFGVGWDLDRLQTFQNAAQRVRRSFEVWTQQVAQVEETSQVQLQRQYDILREERERRHDAQREQIAEREARALEEQRRKTEARQVARQQAQAEHNARLAERAAVERVAAEARRLAADEAAEQSRADEERRRARLREEETRRLAAQDAERQTARLQEEERRREIEARQIARQRALAAYNYRLAKEAEIERVEAETRRIAAVEAEHQSRVNEEHRRARLRDCAVCMEEHDLEGMTQLLCQHWYCAMALQNAISTACEARRPFQCCGQTVLADHVREGLLNAQIIARYRAMVEETQEANPVYCSNAACATFLPSRLAIGPDEVQCPGCGRSTCRHCKGPSHSGVCAADRATQQARELSRAQGWKACPRCHNMVEKSSGCLRKQSEGHNRHLPPRPSNDDTNEKVFLYSESVVVSERMPGSLATPFTKDI